MRAAGTAAGTACAKGKGPGSGVARAGLFILSPSGALGEGASGTPLPRP